MPRGHARMTRIIVLLNLKPGKSAADYERWALATDLPTVSALNSVDSFTLFEATIFLGLSKRVTPNILFTLE